MDRDMEGRTDPAFGANPNTTGQADGGLAADAKDKASELVGNAREMATQRLETKKTHAADTLSGVARSLRSSTEQLHGDEAGAGQYVRQAADQVERLAGFLQQSDVSEMMDQAEDFARRQPVLFVGAAFALGVAGARFLRSSRERLDRNEMGSAANDRPYRAPDMPRTDGLYNRPTGIDSRDGRTGEGLGYTRNTTNYSTADNAQADLGYAAGPGRPDSSNDSIRDSSDRDLS